MCNRAMDIKATQYTHEDGVAAAAKLFRADAEELEGRGDFELAQAALQMALWCEAKVAMATLKVVAKD